MTTKSNLPVLASSKTPKVYKNKKLNNANFADFGLNDYQVFLFAISKLGKVDEHGKYLQPAQLQREHTLTALEFSEAFNVDPKHAYSIIKKAGMKMRTAFIRLEKPDLFSTQEINVLSMAEYHHKEGKITVKFTDDILPHLAQVKQKFVMYNLKEISNFGSLHTTRLYELVQEYQSTGYIIRSIEQLREFFAVGKALPLYANFKIKTFQHAINEINEKTDYNITFTEIKTGRKVTAIQFEFKKTIVEKRFKPDGTQVNNYIKPKHNSDKIEAVKAVEEAPKKPAPIIAQKPQKPYNAVAVEAIKGIQNMLLQKKINDTN